MRVNKYLYIIKHLTERAEFNKFSRFFERVTLEPEIEIIYNLVKGYFERYTEAGDIGPTELQLFFEHEYALHKDKDLILSKIREMYGTNIPDALVQDLLADMVRQSCYARIATEVVGALDTGAADAAFSITGILSEMEETLKNVSEESPFYEPTIDELLAEESPDNGVRWGIPSLDMFLGPLNGGTLGHCFARTNVGKTSFLATVAGHFLSSLGRDEYLLWANNEERKSKVKLRMLTAVTGMTKREIFADPITAQRLYKEKGGHRIKLFDASFMSIQDISSLVKRYPIRVAIIDIGDKVLNFGKFQSNTDRLKALYGMFRTLVKDHPKLDILTAGQASAEADGEWWLKETWMDNSKTGKPGELDYAIGIGGQKPETFEDVDRYVHLCKNKLADGIHAKITMRMNPATGRYYDLS